ncbi:unnamed protein product [Absidia cylindrospora]
MDPHQLRQLVVECMDQEPSTATLDQYLPRIRDVIVHLLHGLKGKQQQLREMDTQTAQMPSPVPPPLTQRDSYRSQDNYHRNTDSYSRSSISLTHSDSTGSNKSGRAYYSQQDRTSPTPLPGTPDRMTQSDYDPYAGGMPRPSVSSNSRKFYGQGSTPSSPKQQQQSRKPYYTSATSVPSQQPFPSQSASAHQQAVEAQQHLLPHPHHPHLLLLLLLLLYKCRHHQPSPTTQQIQQQRL